MGETYTAKADYSLVEFASRSAPGNCTPGLHAGEHIVQGELYVVDDTMMDVIDDFEDVGVEYKRVSVDLVSGDRAWTYVYIGEREFADQPQFIEHSGFPKALRWMPEAVSAGVKKVA